MSNSPTPDDDIAALVKVVSELLEIAQLIVDAPDELYLDMWEKGYEVGQRDLARRILTKLDI